MNRMKLTTRHFNRFAMLAVLSMVLSIVAFSLQFVGTAPQVAKANYAPPYTVTDTIMMGNVDCNRTTTTYYGRSGTIVAEGNGLVPPDGGGPTGETLEFAEGDHEPSDFHIGDSWDGVFRHSLTISYTSCVDAVTAGGGSGTESSSQSGSWPTTCHYHSGCAATVYATCPNSCPTEGWFHFKHVEFYRGHNSPLGFWVEVEMDDAPYVSTMPAVSAHTYLDFPIDYYNRSLNYNFSIDNGGTIDSSSYRCV
jgi:hypothetical protein